MKKSNKNHMPTYIDGVFYIYKIVENDDIQSKIKLINTGNSMCFNELSITDRLRSDLNAHDVDISLKIRIPYARNIISSKNVLKINGKYYKVYNAYHFLNSNGFRETDITLTNWGD